MPVSGLTDRDRVARMFQRQAHDRVPRCDCFWNETIARWQTEGLKGDASTVLEMLGCDLQGLSWVWPAPYERATVISEDDQTRLIHDEFGKTVRYWKNKSGTPEHVAFECTGRDVWEKKTKPAMLARKLQVNMKSIRSDYAKGRRLGRWCHLSGVESFEQTRAIMGDETTLMAMVEDPDWVRDVSRTHTDLLLRNFDAAIDHGIQPDGVWIYGDMAYNHSTMCSPAMYKELIWPDHKRLADWTHQRGMKLIYHSDGNINGVLDLLIKAGIDCIQPLEAKAGMDVRTLAPKYGRKIAFFGNINVMTMGTNNHDLLEEEIRSKFKAAMATRGYMYHSDHSVPPTVSWETYQFIMRLVKKYGKYER